jgi:GcrA cell cycle regulator
MAVNWTEERVDALTRMWREGYTARQIAEGLGDGITRNAVIGKANRLGLSKPTKSSVTRQQRKVEREHKVRPLRAPEGEGATILNLTSSTCRWPIGDPGDSDFHFCGAKCEAGQPYCEYHAAMAYQVPQPKSNRRNIA